MVSVMSGKKDAAVRASVPVVDAPAMPIFWFPCVFSQLTAVSENLREELAEAGVTSLKIEGRAKSAYYVAVVTNAYRMAVDEYYKNPDNFILPDWIKDEVYKVSHRKYSNGFFFGRPQESQYYENSGYIRNYDVVAVVEDCRDGRVYCTQRKPLNPLFRFNERFCRKDRRISREYVRMAEDFSCPPWLFLSAATA